MTENQLPKGYEAGKSLQVIGLDGKEPIKWNIEQFSNNLDVYLKPFKNIDLDTSSVKEIKGVVAGLRKYAKECEDVRKVVKKALDKQYQEMKTIYDPVFQLLNDETQRFTAHLDEKEAIRKEKKKTEIVAIYNRESGSLESFLSFDAIFNKYGDSWLNLKPTLSEIEGKIIEGFVKIKHDLNAIDGMESPFRIELREEYKRTFNMSQVVQKNNDLMAVKKAEDARTEKQALDDEAQRLRDVEALKGLEEKAVEVDKLEDAKRAIAPVIKTVKEIRHEKPGVATGINADIVDIEKGDLVAEEVPTRILAEVTFTAFFTSKDQIELLGKFCKKSGIELEVQGA